MFGELIAEHNNCGGTQWYVLKVGSLVTLAGKTIIPGQYRVSAVIDYPARTDTWAKPHPYDLQTCLSATMIRLWYMLPV